MNLINFLLYFIFPLAFGIFLYLKKKFSHFEKLGIPHLKPDWPLGNMGGMGTKFHLFDLLLKLYGECKGKDVICGIYNLIEPVYVVIDPEVVKLVMVKDFNNFVNRGFYVNEENEPLSGGKIQMKKTLI